MVSNLGREAEAWLGGLAAPGQRCPETLTRQEVFCCLLRMFGSVKSGSCVKTNSTAADSANTSHMSLKQWKQLLRR